MPGVVIPLCFFVLKIFSSLKVTDICLRTIASPGVCIFLLWSNTLHYYYSIIFVVTTKTVTSVGLHNSLIQCLLFNWVPSLAFYSEFLKQRYYRNIHPTQNAKIKHIFVLGSRVCQEECTFKQCVSIILQKMLQSFFDQRIIQRSLRRQATSISRACLNLIVAVFGHFKTAWT